MLVIISDLHLTDGTAVHQNISPKQVQDFWHNINRSKRSLISFRKRQEPVIELVILGDFLDLIRSNLWNHPGNKGPKPWDPPSKEQKEVLSKIIDGIFKHNKETLATLKKFLSQRQVKTRYMIGKHDHLLLRYPDLLDRVYKETGMAKPTIANPVQYYEHFWPEYGVMAHHGDRGDPWNDSRGVLHPIGDAMVTEIYNRLPIVVSNALSGGDALKNALGNLVYVRPYRYAPHWILKVTQEYGEESVIKRIWNHLVEDFLEIDFVKNWIHETKKLSNVFNHAVALRTTLRLSHRMQIRTLFWFSRFGEFVRRALAIESRAVKGIRKELMAMDDPKTKYLVNGHTHNAGILPVGKEKGRKLIYVNTGTWTRSLLPDRLGSLEPVEQFQMMFTPSDFISLRNFL